MAPSPLANSGLALRAALKRGESSGFPGAGVDAANTNSSFTIGVKIAIIVFAVLAFGGVIALRFYRWKKRKAQYAAQN